MSTHWLLNVWKGYFCKKFKDMKTFALCRWANIWHLKHKTVYPLK